MAQNRPFIVVQARNDDDDDDECSLHKVKAIQWPTCGTLLATSDANPS